ncbi:hypothetical protein [Rhizobium binxianense]|uniref:hypothetical protein n=1 Tax=Rhizobium binxianense TaxID=3024242 RepID=UPI00236024FE|nr:hypothetical protein [Rhizobium sp. MJ37]MDC9835906.1 hypothetical protein [Rhizobium sp. MJ37]
MACQTPFQSWNSVSPILLSHPPVTGAKHPAAVESTTNKPNGAALNNSAGDNGRQWRLPLFPAKLATATNRLPHRKPATIPSPKLAAANDHSAENGSDRGSALASAEDEAPSLDRPIVRGQLAPSLIQQQARSNAARAKRASN